MENKLQELTKKLYDEGLSKGRQDADTLLAEAQQKAKKIVADAEHQAEQAKRTAEKNADDLHRQTLAELGMAGKQMVGQLKGEIADMVVARSAKDAVKQALLDGNFIKELLLAVASNWKGSSSEKVSLVAMLPADREKELGQALEGSVREQIGDGLELVYSDGVKSGFRIAPKNGGYYIDFSDDSFYALLGEYLRPKVKEILFDGENNGK